MKIPPLADLGVTVKRSLLARFLVLLLPAMVIIGLASAGLMLQMTNATQHLSETQIWSMGLVGAARGLAVCAAAAIAFHVLVSRPLRGLIKAIRDRSEGREWRTPARPLDNALGDVIDAFESMVHRDIEREHMLRRTKDELRKQQDELAYLNGTLEQLVQRRTHQLELAKKEAEAANAAKSRFLWSMSHELRTPLNAIIGFSEMIEQGSFGPVGNARYVEYAGDISASGRHLLSIINSILTIAKIEAGVETLKETEIDLEDFIDECMRMIAPLAEKSQLKVRRSGETIGLRVFADETKLRQIVLNVLSNAVKFNREGGQVIISARCDAHGLLELAIRDTGIGMRLEDIPAALKEFGQIDNSLGRRYEGTGLGLPIANKLAIMHGGGISVTSAPDIGTTVTLRLPAERVLQPEAAAKTAQHSR